MEQSKSHGVSKVVADFHRQVERDGSWWDM